MNYTSSIKYLLFNKFSNLFITFFSGIVLARLIDVEDFGVVAIINIISSFFITFKEFGFTTSLIQKKEVSEKLYSTVFWFNYLVSLFIISIILLSSNWLSEYYNEPQLYYYLLVSSISFLISPLSSVSLVILTRKMKFDIISKVNILSIFISSIFGIALAFNGFEGWTLIFQSIILILLNTLIIFFRANWYPKFIFSTSELKTVLSFSSYVTLDSFINYFARNLDSLLIGKFLGTQSLAYYNRAYSLMLMPVNNISSAVKQALFPAISNFQDNNQEIKKMYLNTVFYISLLSFPAMFGLYAISDEVISFLYGSKWEASASILKYLCLLGAVQSILTLNGTVYNGKGRADLAFKYGFLFNINALVFIIIGVYLGSVEKVAICYLIACCINSIPSFYVVLKLIELNIKELIKNIYLQFLAASLMLFFISCIKEIVSFGEIQNMITFIVLGICIYTSIILLFSFKIRNLIWKKIR